MKAILMSKNQVYIKRRKKLIKSLESEPNNGLVIIPTADEVFRNQDSTYQYRYDSNFYYLTGFIEPEAVLVLDIANKKNILFCREKDPKHEVWDGFRHGVEGACETFGFDEAYPITEFPNKIIDMMGRTPNLYYTVGNISKYDQVVTQALKTLREKFGRGVEAPRTIIDINYIVAEMRLFKDAHDVELITKTCKISGLAHIAAMQFIKQAKYEYEVEAKMLEVFYKYGARYPSYTPIIASGSDACILHYVANNKKIEQNALILIDAGCEYEGYAGDITRTYPVSGKFTREQQAIYEIVLEANKQSIDAVQIGSPWNTPGQIAIEILTRGLIDLKLLKGSVVNNIEKGNYKQFYMHGIGHWLGLDVHDVGSYQINGNWRHFEAGMCTTIEPGLYIRPAKNVPEKYWNIGVRIEDDILLTKHVVVNLTHKVPKEVKDLEYIINHEE